MKKIIIVTGWFLFSVTLHSQNVGIGTVAPSSKLSVVGTETATHGESASIKIQNLAAPSLNAWYLRAGATGTTTPSGGFSIADNTGYRFNITNTGSIGIGTTTPSEQLTILSGNISLLSSNKGILLNAVDGPMVNKGFDPFTSGNYIGLGRWGLFMEPNILTLGIPEDTPLKGSPAFAISSYTINSTVYKQLFKVTSGITGNALVEVNGKMEIQGSNTLEFGAGIAGKEINAGKIGYNSFATDALSIVGSGTTAANRKIYVFAEGGTTINGPVGIGINFINPLYKLAVNGNIRAKEIIVESGWADYVFNKEYKLPSLYELEKFILQFNHLPNIPSAAEIEKDGLKVGELQKKMMEKIEELTLYVIAQKKENEELKKRVGQLEKIVK
ncbi:MAG: hypothetical protein ACKVOW_02145 [Chitinophagaceae bacterium]